MPVSAPPTRSTHHLRPTVRDRLAGLLLAFSWLTVLPVGRDVAVDRAAAGRAITAIPVVGVALGTVSVGVLAGSLALGLAFPLAGLIAVTTSVLLTRGMHVDGLADTADGLGCYGPPERAREVMKSGSAGPFGVAAVALVLAMAALGLGQLADRGSWPALVIVPVIARVAAVLACRRGTGAATDDGFGSLVAGTQALGTVAAWSIAAVAISVVAVPERPWQGPIVVVTILLGSAVVVRHCVRRFGGLSGDVLGATIASTTALLAIGFLLGS